MGRDQSNQGRGSNLTDADRSKGGQTSSQEQGRNSQGEWTGTTGNTGGQGMGGSSGMQPGPGRGSNLTEEDRRRGGETSSQEQGRDSQGEWTGKTGGNQGQGYGNQGQGSSLPRDDQGQWKSPQGGQGKQNR